MRDAGPRQTIAGDSNSGIVRDCVDAPVGPLFCRMENVISGKMAVSSARANSGR